MEDKDTEIVEEFIRNYKEVQEKYKDDEIQAEIERSCYFEEVPAIQIEKLLRAYKNIKIQLQEQKNINKKLSLEAQKYFDALMEDEKVIYEMVNYMVQEMAEYQLDDIYAELYNCNGLERNWTRGDIEEIKDILNYFRKKCE